MEEASYLTRHPKTKDALQFGVFVVLVIVGSLLINTFLFRSFIVNGYSMDDTLADSERLIVNRLPLTAAQLKNATYFPERGEVIVFKNPRYVAGQGEEYIVKRVIAFPGERVTVEDGTLTVFNDEYPDGKVYDEDYRHGSIGPKHPSSGDGVNVTVPDGTVFVAGDNRIGSNSYDSRTGLGFIPTFDIVGPVSLRIWPLTKLGGVE